MSVTGKEYKLAIRIAGVIDKSFSTSLVAANSTLKRTVAAVDKDLTRLDKGFDAIMGYGSKAFHAVATAATVAATAIGAAAVAAVNVGMEFERQMSAVQAISGATAEELAQLEDKARELGQTSVFSATEVGKAMEYMGMAGWKTEQMIAGIKGVLDLAAASGEDLAMASDIVTDVLTAFHMEAEETARMVDVMAQAAMNSNTNVEMMGETFKYAGTVAGAMGYTIEDMAIATGLMASSGIKASNAGTALRNIITRMAKPTKESAEAMEALGLSLERDDGSMYSLLEIMEQMRAGMAGMTETEKAYYAAELGGQRGMPGLLAIANSTDEQFRNLAEAIYNAEGAAQRMADIRLDNLAGDVEIFNDTLADAGIELSQELNGPLRSLIQRGTGFISGAATQIPRVVNKIGTEFPTLQRKFRKFAKPVFSGIVGLGKWIAKHGKGIISVIAGIGAALAAYKAASAIVHIVNAIMSLGSLNPVTLGILGAAGVLASMVAAYKQHEQELVDRSLADHFGNIALSMEDLQRIAKEIVGTDDLEQIMEALEAFEGADQIADTISGLVAELNKHNWKVSIGLELTEEEQQSYQDTIEEYVAQMQEYVLHTQYAVHLNFSAGADGGDGGVAEKVNQFYQDSYEEMERLGRDLSEAVNAAFADKVLDPEELEEITSLQAKMADLQASLAASEMDAQLIKLSEKLKGTDLTPESFQNLQEEIAKQIGIAEDTYLESYARSVSAVKSAYNAGYLAQEEYKEALAGEDRKYLDNMSAAYERAMSFQLETVSDAYGGDIDSAIDSMLQKLSEFGSQGWYDRASVLFEGMAEHLGLDGDFRIVRKSIEELLEGMGPTREGMENLKARYEALGMEVPEAIEGGIRKAELLEDISGLNMSGDVWKLIGEHIASGEYGEYYEELFTRWNGNPDLYGAQNIPSEVMEGIESGKAGIQAAADASAEAYKNAAIAAFEEAHSGFAVYTQEYIDEWCANNFLNADAVVEVNLSPVYRLRQSEIPALDLDMFTGIGIDRNADGGIIWNKELSWLAEEGPEAVIPLDGSRNAVSLWEKAGRLLGMGSAFDDLDLGGGDMVTVQYSPVLNFYGEAPNRDDLTDALDISQDKFDSLMERYLKTHSRVSLG